MLFWLWWSFSFIPWFSSPSALWRENEMRKTLTVFCSHLQTGVQAVSERSRIEIVGESGTLCLNISKIENCCQFQLMMDSFSKRNSYLASKFEVKKLWNSRITDFYFSSIQSKIFYQITPYLWRSKLILTHSMHLSLIYISNSSMMAHQQKYILLCLWR